MAAGFLVKGILIGLIFGIPVGAVGTLTVQRAYQHGFGAGLKTGMGPLLQWVSQIPQRSLHSGLLFLILELRGTRQLYKESGL